jgi:hypothetical protein
MRTKKQIKEDIGKKRHKHNLRKQRKQSQENMYEDGFGDLHYSPNLMAMSRKQSPRKTEKEKEAEKRAYRKLVKDRPIKKGGRKR